MSGLERYLLGVWYGGRRASFLLPLVPLYRLLGWLRNLSWRWRRPRPEGVAVIVVGNISVGGTGKTPLVLELARRASERGEKVALIARGHGGRHAGPLRVSATTDVAECGDEALLLARRSGLPVYIARRRAEAAALAAAEGARLVISDDGLQHPGLARTAEIVVVDAARGLGNGHLLPAGPLRESPARLARVAAVFLNGRAGQGDFWLEPGELYSLDRSRRARLADFAGRQVAAVAALGNPQRFFDLLERSGLDVKATALPDHGPIEPVHLRPEDGRPVMVTEKDAVKCRQEGLTDVWVVPVNVVFAAPAEAHVERLLDRLLPI